MSDGSITIDTKVNGDGVKNSLGKIGNIASTAMKTTAVAIGTVTTAFAGLVVASVNARGELEQQIGGVQTLFKNELGDASAEVIKNANNAYKTAGMSAIEYMQTATSFSASLLKSLGGDTKKAAKTTDMAISDMSDNANKMGTSMEAIQNAYQGFAKQNYTMLDNLKLGYGGTKTEMERLLKDAQKLTGVKYNINSLDDVYNAIHAVQDELGITGTTAKEASETLQGSFSSMKASWNNFLSGSGDLSQVVATATDVVTNVVKIANEAIPQIIENLVTSLPQLVELGGKLINSILAGITTYLPQLITSAGQIIQTLLTVVIEYLPAVLEAGIQILNSIIQGIVATIPQLIPVILEAVKLILEVVTENLPSIIEAGIQILISLITGIVEMIPELIPQMIECIFLIVDTVLDNLDKIIEAGIDILLALIDGIVEALPELLAKAPEIIIKLVSKLIEPAMLAKLISAALQLIFALVKGLIGAIPELLLAVPKIITGLKNDLEEKFKNTDWGQIGRNMVEGLWNGIKNMGNWLKDKIFGFASGITNSIKSFFGIHSPSVLFRDEIGKMLPRGLAVGVDLESDKAIESVNRMAEDMYNTMQNAVDIEMGKTSMNLSTTASMNKTINVNLEQNSSDIYLDGKKVGQSVTPYVSNTLRLAGV